MDNRRDFLKKVTLLGGGVGMWNALPASIKKALEINPELGSTFYDAEHVVLLMQENRSFDHCFGTLQGVRGYNDPRAVRLPNNNKVWLQTNKEGETYAPFRLDIKNTRSTWTGNLPHSWDNQTDARNNGGFDKWLDVKRSGYKAYSKLPLTLGFYNREDIPFYYSMADAFTVCDQHFCSSLTGTTPNRLFFFTGKLRGGKNNQANVDNGNVDYSHEVDWETFPQRLEESSVSWKVYQNEISLDTGLQGAEDFWLGNFTDNPLEWFKQHRVRFSKEHYNHCTKLKESLPGEIIELKKKLANAKDDAKLKKLVDKKEKQLSFIKKELKEYTPEKFAALSQAERNLHDKAFTTNAQDPDFHQLESINIEIDGEQKTMEAPKGDVFYQFRKDVQENKLPTVSWLVAPQAFSDHPSAPWYGAWYVSETLDILTQNPEVWKKTIFILTYDENDGYFDHVPPFVVPNPNDKSTGAVTDGIDAHPEYVTLEEDILRLGTKHKQYARESPVGMGYRVPMVIASPWTRGGWVNSQVFDHTSALQFLEKFLEKKTKNTIIEKNIGSWRRAISGDLTSAFRQYNGEAVKLPFVKRNAWLESIQSAKNKQIPDGWHLMKAADIKRINETVLAAPFMPQQEAGIRNACALPYELYVKSRKQKTTDSFQLTFEASNELFGKAAIGAAFNVYAPGNYWQKNEQGIEAFSPFKVWAFSVEAGKELSYEWPLQHFENGAYHLQVHGPNGFYNEYKGAAKDKEIEATYKYKTKANGKLSGEILLHISNPHNIDIEILVKDNAYKNKSQKIRIPAGSHREITMPTRSSYGWYDCSIKIRNNYSFERRFAGRIETGKHSKTDPLMGGLL